MRPNIQSGHLLSDPRDGLSLEANHLLDNYPEAPLSEVQEALEAFDSKRACIIDFDPTSRRKYIDYGWDVVPHLQYGFVKNKDGMPCPLRRSEREVAQILQKRGWKLVRRTRGMDFQSEVNGIGGLLEVKKCLMRPSQTIEAIKAAEDGIPIRLADISK